MTKVKKFENWKILLLITVPILAVVLIVLGKDGYGFGIIALICWALAFLDLARIKFGDCEIDFMTKKAVLTDEERKIFKRNYDLVCSFVSEYLKIGYVNGDVLDIIYKAFDDARLNLPDDIVKFTEMWANKAKDAFILHHQWERLPVGEERSKLIDEEFEITKEVLAMKPAEIYRKYLKVEKHDKD